MVLAVILGIAGLACNAFVLVAMFKDEIWMGILGLFCGLYTLYYAIFEFDHEHKWLIVGGAVVLPLLSVVFTTYSG